VVPSSEVDIIQHAGLAGSIEQMDQSSAFCHSCSPANQDNDAAMGLRISLREEVVPITCNENGLGLARVGENLLIASFFWQHFAQACYTVAEH